jgi:hypothetical protein
MQSSWQNEKWQGKLKYLEKTCPSIPLSTTNPTWPDLGSTLGHHGGKLATNYLSYGMTLHILITRANITVLVFFCSHVIK